MPRSGKLVAMNLGTQAAKEAGKPIGASALLRRNLFIYGFGGLVAPFDGIKLLDLVMRLFV